MLSWLKNAKISQNQDLQVQKNMNGNKQVKSKERKTVNIKSHSKTGRKNCYLKW